MGTARRGIGACWGDVGGSWAGVGAACMREAGVGAAGEGDALEWGLAGVGMGPALSGAGGGDAIGAAGGARSEEPACARDPVAGRAGVVGGRSDGDRGRQVERRRIFCGWGGFFSCAGVAWPGGGKGKLVFVKNDVSGGYHAACSKV